MIYTEDKELETFALTEGDIAVPIEIFVPASGGEPDITVYSVFYKEAEKLLAQFPGGILSDDAISFMNKAILPYMTDRGFVVSPDKENRIQEYSMTDIDKLKCGFILSDTKRIHEYGEVRFVKNLLSQLPVSNDEIDAEFCVIHTVDGHVVACASENDTYFDDESVEIHVECAPLYRGKGYATSCVSKLCEEILRQGRGVRYHCRLSNHASCHIARKVGFDLLGTRLSLVFYREGFV